MGSEVAGSRYTDKQYWENYYRPLKMSAAGIKQVVGFYDFHWEKLISSCRKKPETILEIGAYPGRYLAYLSWKYNLQPTALDFNSDITKFKHCFSLFNIENYQCITADFLEHKSDIKYDLVISNGFVEHFQNFEEVMDKHCQYLAPGGAMLIMIPNLRYLKKWYANLLDPENLKIHNLECMNLEVFRKFAGRNNLDIKYLSYFGGFAFKVHQKLNFGQKIIYHGARNIFKLINPLLIKNPNRFFSSSIIAIYTKK